MWPAAFMGISHKHHLEHSTSENPGKSHHLHSKGMETPSCAWLPHTVSYEMSA